MTPRERAVEIVGTWPAYRRTEYWIRTITTAIQAACNGELELGRARMAALQAALEELARVTKERDGLAAVTELIGNTLLRVEINPANYTHEEVCALNDAASVAFQLADHDMGPAALASHDRQVAARVLRSLGPIVLSPFTWEEIKKLADEFEAGEREVPSAS